MKIRPDGTTGFVVETTKGTLGCDTTPAGAILHAHADLNHVEADGRSIALPGEYEIGGVLIRGLFSRPGNAVYRFIVDDLTVATFGNFLGEASKEFYTNLGEHIDVALVRVNDVFDAKKLDKFIDTLSPGIVLIIADPAHYPKLKDECGAELFTEKNFSVKRSDVDSEATKVFILAPSA